MWREFEGAGSQQVDVRWRHVFAFTLKHPVERVEQLQYLVGIITKDLSPEVEIKRRIRYAKTAFVNMKILLTKTVEEL